MNATDFIIAGVGGQGALLASDVIAEVGMSVGLDVKKSDVHGMAQRGGAVISHVRWGPEVYSPLVERGCADFLIALEMLESLRWLPYLKPGGTVIVNHQQIRPASTVFGDDEYNPPEEILGQLDQVAGKVLYIEGTQIAERLGNVRASNTVLLGALSSLLDLNQEQWLNVLLQRVPSKAIELNRKAFLAGADQAKDVKPTRMHEFASSRALDR
jgi:indolepyruvate ferredoxin oxidoreductase beta subunit